MKGDLLNRIDRIRQAEEQRLEQKRLRDEEQARWIEMSIVKNEGLWPKVGEDFTRVFYQNTEVKTVCQAKVLAGQEIKERGHGVTQTVVSKEFDPNTGDFITVIKVSVQDSFKRGIE